MSEPIKLSAIDMDGTLLRSDKTVDPQTAEDIRTAVEKGIQIAYCTGRGTAEMQDTFRALPMIRYAVLTSGAVVYDRAEDRFLYQNGVGHPYIEQIVETAALVGDKLDIYSGNDDQVAPILALGGSGVISVLSNIMPRATSEMCHRWFRGDIEGSRRMQLDYLPLINALFCEVNPIPVKAAMAAMGFCENSLRLPLTPMEDAHRQVLLQCMRDQGVNV